MTGLATLIVVEMVLLMFSAVLEIARFKRASTVVHWVMGVLAVMMVLAWISIGLADFLVGAWS